MTTPYLYSSQPVNVTVTGGSGGGGGSSILVIVSTSTNYSANSNELIKVDATSGNKTVTLPPASNETGKVVIIKKIDSSLNTVVIARSGSDTIDGATSRTIRFQYQGIEVVSDGVNWAIRGII